MNKCFWGEKFENYDSTQKSAIFGSGLSLSDLFVFDLSPSNSEHNQITVKNNGYIILVLCYE